MSTAALERVGACRRCRSPKGRIDGEYRPFPDVGHRNAWQEHVEVPVLAWTLDLPRGVRVLEVGCGRGVALPVLAARLRPARLVGLDVDGGLLAQAAARLRERSCAAELVAADVRDMPFPDASFDLVLDFGTCYHVARPGRALREVSRVLADGGRLVHETRLSQHLSHPLRALGRRLPWDAAPCLWRGRHALLWAMHTKRAGRDGECPCRGGAARRECAPGHDSERGLARREHGHEDHEREEGAPAPDDAA